MTKIAQTNLEQRRKKFAPKKNLTKRNALKFDERKSDTRFMSALIILDVNGIVRIGKLFFFAAMTQTVLSKGSD